MAYTELPLLNSYGYISNWLYTVGGLTDPSSQVIKPNTSKTLLFTHFNIGMHGASSWLFRNQEENIQPAVTLRVADPAEATMQQWTFPYMNSSSGFNANFETEIVLHPENGFNVIINSIYSGSADISFRFYARSIEIDPSSNTPFS